MTFFILFLFLFSIFFTFDNKPINLLLDFIGIILSLSFYLLLTNNTFDLSFFSFIFLIIYGSALAILFAFIIMLFSDTKPSFLPYSFFTFPNSLSYPLKFLFNSNLKLLHFINSYFPYLIIFFFLFGFIIIYYFFYSSSFHNSNPFNVKSISFLAYANYLYNDLSIFNIINDSKAYPISNMNISFIYYIFNSFIYNHIPLILIINILLLGLIGAVFLLI